MVLSTTDKRFFADYVVSICNGDDIKKIARDICIEQTVEIPEDCVPDEIWENGIVGNVESITQSSDNPLQFFLTISYHCDISSYSVSQILNTLFGNISLKNNIRIVNLRIDEQLSGIFPGPQWGIDGIRKYLNVYDRALTSTALKPVGLTAESLAEMAGNFALGGADIIKDDHGITNQPFAPFEKRVALVQNAINEANSRTGKRTIYCPMLNDDPEELKRQVDICQKHGIKGALAAPLLIGCGMFASIRKSTDMMLMAHPAFAGTFFHSPLHGATPAFLLGTLFKLIGADISIFPNWGGRFLFTKKECNDLADSLRLKIHNHLSAFPAPAGGMKISRIPQIYEQYGKDTVIIIGGNLQQLSNNLVESTSMFTTEVEKSSLVCDA